MGDVSDEGQAGVGTGEGVDIEGDEEGLMAMAGWWSSEYSVPREETSGDSVDGWVEGEWRRASHQWWWPLVLAWTSSSVARDNIFEKVINPYLGGVLQNPQSIEMREGLLHIHDVEGPKKTGSMEVRLEEMEQQVFKCQGMVERGLNANHMMITEFTNKHKIDANDIGKHLSRLYDRIDHLQAQI
ncbi:40S ribosomal protein S5-1 [Hordeum vulgare]|nr:40S ribosomal protein S5-1 [Hordeum vulgare]